MNVLKRIILAVKGVPTCEKVNGFLLDYVDGNLPEKTARKFEAHLDMCPNCRNYLEQYQETIRLVRQDSVDVPEQLVEHTLAFLRSRRSSSL